MKKKGAKQIAADRERLRDMTQDCADLAVAARKAIVPHKGVWERLGEVLAIAGIFGAEYDSRGMKRRKHGQKKEGFVASEAAPGLGLEHQLAELAMAESLVSKWGLRSLFQKLGIGPEDLRALHQLAEQPKRSIAMYGRMIANRRALEDFLSDPTTFIEAATADRVEDAKSRALDAVDRKVKAAEAERQAVADLAGGIGTDGDNG